jgi:hypothetical protein
MNQNFVGSIYGRFSIKIAHFVLIHLQTCPPQAILISDWLISKKYSPLKPLDQMKQAIFIEDLPWMLPTKFQFIWLRGFRGED